MNQDHQESEQQLRESFQRLRAEDTGAAPEFGALRRRPVRQPRGDVSSWRRGVVLAAAAVIAIVVIGLSRTHPQQPGYPIDLASTTWHGPTDFLLRYPTDPALRTVPRLGAIDPNWRTP